VRRGDVWWADLEAAAGRRPVVLLSRDEAYLIRAYVTVAPVSSRIRGLQSEVRLDRADGMPQSCAVNLDSIVTIAKEQLISQITSLNSPRVKELDAALHFALGLES
jgi:mRNA interferase MazF